MMARTTLPAPGTLIFRQQVRGVVDNNLVGKIRPPLPQHHVRHRFACTGRKRRHQNSSGTVADEPFGQTPRRRLLAIRKIVGPRACQFVAGRSFGRLISCRSKINHIRYVDVVRTSRERFKAIGKAMTHFEKHAFDRQGQIECRCTDGVEPTAFARCALAGRRCPRPFRVVGSEACTGPPQTKPPVATWSR